MSQPTGDLHEYTRQVAEFWGVPYDMAERLLWSESGYSHYAANGNVLLENGGRGVGVGISQIARPTARQYGLDPEDPRQNIYAGIRYLREQYNTFHTWPLAYAAYRAGPGAVTAANNQIPAGVSQESIDFFLGKSGATLHGRTVGQGGIPAAGADYTQRGAGTEPGDNGATNPLDTAIKPIQDAITGLPAALGKGVSEALTEAGIQSSNKVAEWWNANSGTAIFYGIALLSLIGAAIVLKGTTVVNVVNKRTEQAKENAPKAIKSVASGGTGTIKPISQATNIRAS